MGDGLGPPAGPRAAARPGPQPRPPRRARRAGRQRLRPRRRASWRSRRRKQADRLIEREQERNLRAAGREGRAVLHGTSTSSSPASNAQLRADKSEQKPYTRVDIFGFMALAGELFGRGGGDEARRSQFLDGLRDALGPARAQRSSTTCRRRTTRTARTRGTKAFPYNRDPDSPRRATWSSTTAACSASTHGTAPAAASVNAQAPHASNFLMVAGQPLDQRAPAVRRRPADRLLLPRAHARGGHQWPGHTMRGIYSPPTPA